MLMLAMKYLLIMSNSLDFIGFFVKEAVHLAWFYIRNLVLSEQNNDACLQGMLM